ncbi:MAG: hypothetical protein ACO26I_02520 [Burkholderiaceae bacterium]
MLGGAVHSWASDRPIPAVAVSLHHTPGSGPASPIDSTSTNTFGAWSFDQLDFDQFSPRAQKTITAHDVKAVSAADVLAALKIAHGRNANADPDGPEALIAAPPSPHQLLSADLDRDGRVSAADARAILRDAISTTPESAAAVRWIFFDQAQNLSPASRSNLPSPAPIVAEASLSTDVRLIGILLGDVDGSWTPV